MIAISLSLAAACAGRGAGTEGASVRAFGAVGDGRADDTEAVQRAVERSGDVLFPRGTYRITRTIRVDLDRAGPAALVGLGTAVLVMEGPGPALRLAGTHAGTAAPESVAPAVWERQRMPRVAGLEIRGAHPEAVGVEVSGAHMAVLDGLLIRRALHGIVLTGRNRNIIVSSCHLYDNRGAGLLLEKLNLHQINVIGCHVSYNRGGGIVVRASEIRNLQIGTCDIEANMGPETPPAANVFLDVTEGSIREGAIVGCTLQHTARGPHSANVRLLGREKEPHKVGHFAISDNAMSDAAVNIHLRHARGVTITGNTLWQAETHGLLVEGSSNVVVGPNLLDRNPDYKPDTPDGVLFQDSSDCTLTGLHLSGTKQAEAALILSRCRRFNVTSCTILDTDHAGILLRDVEESRVSGCLVRDGRTPAKASVSLKAAGGRGNLLTGNVFAQGWEVDAGTADAGGNRRGP